MWGRQKAVLELAMFFFKGNPKHSCLGFRARMTHAGYLPRDQKGSKPCMLTPLLAVLSTQQRELKDHGQNGRCHQALTAEHAQGKETRSACSMGWQEERLCCKPTAGSQMWWWPPCGAEETRGHRLQLLGEESNLQEPPIIQQIKQTCIWDHFISSLPFLVHLHCPIMKLNCLSRKRAPFCSPGSSAV